MHNYTLEIYGPGDRKTADTAMCSDGPFMAFVKNDLLYLPYARKTVIIEQTLRIVFVSDKDGVITDKICVYTRENV